MAMLQNVSGVSNTGIDLLAEYDYSMEDSGAVYLAFIAEQGYVAARDYKLGARKVHKRFPLLTDLQAEIDDKGIIKVCKEYFPEIPVGKISAYLYFLVMIGLLHFSFTDYYRVNTKTLTRLKNWYTPYFHQFYISEALENTKKVMNRNSHANSNNQRSFFKAMYTYIYLVMRYRLSSITELTEKQWLEFRTDMENNTTEAKWYTKATFIQQALWEMEILPNCLPEKISSLGKPTFLTKKYLFDTFPMIMPITDLYKGYCAQTYSKKTAAHKLDDLDTFFLYLKENFDTNFSLERLTRGIIHDYVSDIKSRDYSDSYKQAKAYAVKKFIEFVLANSSEFNSKGFLVCENKVLVAKDFHLKQTFYLPRPINKEVLKTFLNCLPMINDEKFRLFFKIMLLTGIPQREALHLTRDCSRKIGDTKFQLLFYREKVRKFKIVGISIDAYMIIQQVRKMNTQIKPLPHPDGKEEFYLFNDGGHDLGRGWYWGCYNRLKKYAIEKNKEMADVIRDVSIHQLRHTFATEMRDRGADIIQLAQLLAHDNINTTMKYVRESDDKKLEMLEKLESRLICDTMPKDAQGSALSLQFVKSLISYKNDMGIGHCIVEATENCPAAYRCIDCMYLCSTRSDIPEMVQMIKHLNSNLEALKEQGDSQEVEREIALTKKRIQRLTDKISALNIPDVPKKADKKTGDDDILSFI